MMTWPLPSEDAKPVADPETVRLGPNERATVTFSPELSGTRFVVPTVAVSKRADSSYRVKMDEDTVWGPATFPPTDIDDVETVWFPARQFTESLTVKVANLRDSGGERRYQIVPIGFEEP